MANAPAGPIGVPDWTIGDRLRKARRAAGLERDDLANLVVVARTMGHASTSTTMGYVGWNPDAAPIIDAMYTEAA